MEKTLPVILAVDDLVSNIMTVTGILSDKYTVLAATNGPTVFKVLESNDNIDLILLDVLMPGMDGYTVANRLQTHHKFKDIPIIFLTGKSSEEDETYGLELGAVDYVVKPINPAILKARVNTHIRLKRQKDELERLTTEDALTGISNRRQFDRVLAHEWGRSTRVVTSNEECSLLRLGAAFIDIDFFKQYNDHYGHGQGDVCLRQVAQAIRKTFVRINDEVARYGGEEFVALLPQVTHEGVYVCAERVRKAVEDLQIPHAKSEVSQFVTVSVGVASILPEPSVHPASLIEGADEALYVAKKQGRNRFKANYIAIKERQ